MSVYQMDFHVVPPTGDDYWVTKIGRTDKTAHERMWSLLNSVTFSGCRVEAWTLRHWCQTSDDDAVEERLLQCAEDAVRCGHLEKIPTRKEWFRYAPNATIWMDFLDPETLIEEMSVGVGEEG
jgi:hypothetical protein